MSPRRLRLTVLLAPVFIGGCGPLTSALVVPGSGPAPSPPPSALPSGTGLHVLDPYLDERIRAIQAASLRFRAAIDELRNGDRVVYIGTPPQLAQLPVSWVLVGGLMPQERLGEFRVMPDPATGQVDTLVVSVDLERITKLVHRPLLDSRARFRSRLDGTVDAILVHEVWGHVVPVAEAGNIAATCRDPQPGQPDLHSCVMRRENDLRAELGWKVRKTYRFGR